MSPNRLSILFFAAALLIAGTSVTAVLLRLGVGPGFAQAQAVEAANFAGVLAAGSSSDAVAAAPVPAPAMAAAAAAPTRAKAVRRRTERSRPRAVRAHARIEHAAHALVCAETVQAPHLVLHEVARARRRVVVLPCPETQAAMRELAFTLLPRKS